MPERVRAIIDIKALQHNFNLVRTLAPKAKILCMIKANAYGHGLVQVAKNLPADGFGVASLSEALTLREHHITQPIVLMAGFFDQAELPAITKHKVDIVIHSDWQLNVLKAFAKTTTKHAAITVWLKIDTGMHRLGFAPNAVQAAYDTLQALTIVKKSVILMSHFAQSYGLDPAEKIKTQQQIKRFNQCAHACNGLKSLANSAAIFAWPETHHDWVRPGIMLYGASPFDETMGCDHGLKPVMTLLTRLIAINDIAQGECVGYGGTWCARKPTRIGALDIGYGDGYPSNLNTNTPVLIHGIRCPVVGKVSMDRTTIDLSACPQAKIGDEVTLWGRDLPVELIAQHANTLSYQLLTCVLPRVKYEYRYD